MARRLIGTDTTGTDGSVTIPYTGTGAGLVQMDVETEIDGSIVSETLPVLDTLLYDTGTDATHNIWGGDISNLTRGNEYSTLREAEEGTTTRIVTQLPKGLWFLNMQVRRDGSAGNYNFEVIHNNATIFGWATPNNEIWADLKIVYDGEYISCFINDNPTPARKERVYIDETKNTYFRLQTPQAITYLDFKDLLVFREGASSISIGSSTPIIQSGDTATINGSLYESGLPVQNATLDVYKNGTKVDTVNTGSTGVASYTYTGTGAGATEFQFKYGSISSESYSVLDTIFYDSGVTGSSASWTVQSGLTKTQGTEYTTVSATNTGSSTGQMLSNPTFTGDFEARIQTNITYDNSWGLYLGFKGTGYTNVKLFESGWRYIKITRINGVYSFKASTDNINWQDMILQGDNAGSGAVQFQIYLANSTGTEHTIEYKDLRVYPI